MEQNNNSLDDILSALNAINSSLSFNVYLPILKKSVKFKQMTTGQEKRIAKQILVGDNNTIYSIMPDILQENCLDSSIKIENLSIIDFFCAILQTRIYSIGNQITIRTLKKSTVDAEFKKKIKNTHVAEATEVIIDESKNKADSKKTPEKLDIKIDLIKIYESIVDACKNHEKIIVSSEKYPYQITCDIPSVKMIQNKNSDDDDDNLITRLMNFITEIKLVNQKTEEVKTINLLSFNAEDAKRIIENIPNHLLVTASEKIVDFYTLLTTIQLYKFKLEGSDYFQTINFLSLDFFTAF